MMKSKNILVQEEEFLKLNAEIESKTEDLMNQVEQIKGNQLSVEKLYSEWNPSEPNTQIELIANENQNDSEPQEKSPDCNFALNEYFSRRKTDSSNHLKVDTRQKDGPRRNLKLSHSAKITPSLIGTDEDESTLALGITRHKSDVRPRQSKLENDVIPETLRGVGNDGIIRFLSAKVKLLSEQLEIMRKDEKKHLEKIKELQTHKEKSTEERDRFLQQANMTKNALIKCEKQASNLSAQLQSSQIENNNLKKELEAIKKDMRQSNKNYNANEIRLNRTLEEVEKLKTALQQMKHEEKDFRELHRKKTEDLSATIKTLDRQRAELLNGFKKQLLIIDNLKRQRGLIEAAKILKSSEEDFNNFLDCNPPNTTRRTDSAKSVKSLNEAQEVYENIN